MEYKKYLKYKKKYINLKIHRGGTKYVVGDQSINIYIYIYKYSGTDNPTVNINNHIAIIDTQIKQKFETDLITNNDTTLLNDRSNELIKKSKDFELKNSRTDIFQNDLLKENLIKYNKVISKFINTNIFDKSDDLTNYIRLKTIFLSHMYYIKTSTITGENKQFKIIEKIKECICKTSIFLPKIHSILWNEAENTFFVILLHYHDMPFVSIT